MDEEFLNYLHKGLNLLHNYKNTDYRERILQSFYDGNDSIFTLIYYLNATSPLFNNQYKKYFKKDPISTLKYIKDWKNMQSFKDNVDNFLYYCSRSQSELNKLSNTITSYISSNYNLSPEQLAYLQMLQQMESSAKKVDLITGLLQNLKKGASKNKKR